MKPVPQVALHPPQFLKTHSYCVHDAIVHFSLRSIGLAFVQRLLKPGLPSVDPCANKAKPRPTCVDIACSHVAKTCAVDMLRCASAPCYQPKLWGTSPTPEPHNRVYTHV